MGVARAETEATHSVGGEVCAPIGTVWAGTTIRGYGSHYELRVLLFQRLVSKPETPDQIQGLVFEENVGRFQQLGK